VSRLCRPPWLLHARTVHGETGNINGSALQWLQNRPAGRPHALHPAKALLRKAGHDGHWDLCKNFPPASRARRALKAPALRLATHTRAAKSSTLRLFIWYMERLASSSRAPWMPVPSTFSCNSRSRMKPSSFSACTMNER